MSISATAAARIERYFTPWIAGITENDVPTHTLTDLVARGVPAEQAPQRAVAMLRSGLHAAKNIALTGGTSSGVKGLRTMPLDELHAHTGVNNLVPLHTFDADLQHDMHRVLFNHALSAVGSGG